MSLESRFHEIVHFTISEFGTRTIDLKFLLDVVVWYDISDRMLAARDEDDNELLCLPSSSSLDLECM